MIPHSRPDMGTEEAKAVARVARSGRLAQGPEVESFEAECAAFTGRRYAVAVNSGSAALHLALIALGVGGSAAAGMPSYACAALLQAARWQQARVVLGDIGPDFNLSPHARFDGCHAVIVPHLFGKKAAFPPGTPVVEDLAHAIGGDTGRESPVAIASFYATKMITTGEGGMLLTDNADIADCARDRRDYDNRDALETRYNYKMTDMQAALGRVQLRRLPGFIKKRRAIAARYTEAFSNLPLRLPDPRHHVFYRYVVATEQRDALEAHLAACGVDAKRPVYRPLHHYLGGDYPRAEQAHRECLSIPLYPALSEEEIRHVIQSVRLFFDSAS